MIPELLTAGLSLWMDWEKAAAESGQRVRSVMTKPVNAILIHEADDVATAIEELREGDVGRYLTRGEIVEVSIADSIPQYHKFAVRNIRRNERVRKYGEVIGQAVQDISRGNHVHVHNLVSPWRNDL
jgi:altronate dehydratase small subunit